LERDGADLGAAAMAKPSQTNKKGVKTTNVVLTPFLLA
jgi:hypothetical protein